ncbi:PAS domain S-box protein [Clostridium sp. CS001]|uniref:PAS domain-containing sensor histidine kinase n=1 Tax=Clostridium sp. CS001 TaxID=2880648 RepID=UPI001CF30C14|nr:ATP-binding protein [Clostridium sp. CS001]MCB2288570.1 PAS domain S-box protein [Clostridium sp. CS001]
MNLLINSTNFQSCRELIIQVSDTGVITRISQNCYEILGFKQNEMLNTYIDNYLGYSFHDLLLNMNIKTSVSRNRGSKLFFDVESRPITSDDSRIVGLQLSLINISEFTLIEQQYNEFIKVFEKAKDIVFKFQIIPECKFTYISPSVYDILGYDAEAHYLNPNITFENIHPEDMGIQKSKMDKNSDFSKPFCTRFRRKSGNYVWVEDYLIPTYDDNGDLTCISGISRDITERKSMEESLKSKNEFLDGLIDNLELPVVRLSSPDLRILEINQKAIYTLKTFIVNAESISQIKGNKIADIIPQFNESEYFQRISEVIKEQKVKYINKKIHVINGNETYSNFIFAPVLETSGEIKEILVLMIDVTDEVKSSLVMENALKSQGEFLANISHELKTPLNVIYSAVQLFSLYCNSGSLEENKDVIIKYIESIKQNSYRLSKLINNIVDTSKIEAGFFELDLSNNNIVEVVEETVMSVTNFAEIKELNIIFDTNIEEKIIACDLVKIERVVLNLISNAVKFSDKGEEIFVQVKDRNEFVEISVKDNGVGIEKRHMNMIFDRFMQVDKSLSRNAEGTGIGLSLVKSIVELHGGSITVESEFGKGSKFIVRLPAREVMQQNLLFSRNMRSSNENLKVEFSDVYS